MTVPINWSVGGWDLETEQEEGEIQWDDWKEKRVGIRSNFATCKIL